MASSNVFINGAPGLRISDLGIHAACCNANMWQITGASGQVFLNGAQLVRQGDPTQHCGGPGMMIEASGNVVDGSPMMKGMAGFNPVMNLRALNQEAGKSGAGTDPSVLAGIEQRAAQYAGEYGEELAKGLGANGLDAMSQVIDKKVIKFSEDKGLPIPKGAGKAAKALKYLGKGADVGINVVPSVVKGDVHGAIKNAVATGAGWAAGGAVGGACEGVTAIETAGLSTPVCFAAGAATSAAVSWGVGKVYDPVVSVGGKGLSLAGQGLGKAGGAIVGVFK